MCSVYDWVVWKWKGQVQVYSEDKNEDFAKWFTLIPFQHCPLPSCPLDNVWLGGFAFSWVGDGQHCGWKQTVAQSLGKVPGYTCLWTSADTVTALNSMLQPAFCLFITQKNVHLITALFILEIPAALLPIGAGAMFSCYLHLTHNKGTVSESYRGQICTFDTG